MTSNGKAARERARTLLQRSGLRTTIQRLAVLTAVTEADEPVAHREVCRRIRPDALNPATVYRNLVRLREAGLLMVVSRADGITRYALTPAEHDEEHTHAHFVCDACGRVSCLPELSAVVPDQGRWAAAVRAASVQLRGRCPSCMEATDLVSAQPSA